MNLSTAAVWALLSLVLPCLTPVAQAAAPKAATKPVLSDTAIEQNIRVRFAKSKISTNNFQVSVRNGVATLQGRAAVMQHKGTATRIAKSAGARSVINNIQISEEARAKAVANLAKGREKRERARTAARSAVPRAARPASAPPSVARAAAAPPTAAPAVAQSAPALKRSVVTRH